MVFLAVLFGAAGCDHASKHLAITALADVGSVAVAGEMLRLQLTSNPGGFLSLGATFSEGVRTTLFIGVVPLLIVLASACVLRVRNASLALLVGLGLVAGGGLANWLDRLLHGGAVTDFLMIGLGPLRTGIFNVADVAVVAGVGVLAFLAQRKDDPAEGQAA